MYRSIVVGTDGSATAMEAVRQAADMARLSGARLHLVTAYRPAAVLVAGTDAPMVAAAAADNERDLEDGAHRMLEQTASRLRAEGVAVDGHARRGEASEAIIEVAEETNADLIVVGSRGMQGARRFLGSVPNRVSHRAPASVMIVRTC